MTSSSHAPALGRAQVLLRLTAIGVVALAMLGAFLYVGGWLDPNRMTPTAFVDALEKNGGGVHPGFRRNHAKGVCVTGTFSGNGAAASVSSASVFASETTPVLGRFALPAASPSAPDLSAPIRSLALRFKLPNGQEWRTGMNSMPVFPVSTPEAFFGLLTAGEPDPASGKPNPMKQGAFFASHPETSAFLSWVKTAKPSASYATETYWSLNAFYFIDAAGGRHAVRWEMIPDAVAGSDEAPPTGATDFLEADLMKRLAAGPLRWHLRITVADPGDPVDDATKAWPADRRAIDAGILTLTGAQPQAEGACRDVNFDPLVLPAGIEPSKDPLLAARSAAYAESYRRRTREETLAGAGLTRAGSEHP